MRISNTLLPVAALASTAYAWGQLGHRTIALLATRFILPETSVFLQEVLQGEGIARAAVWPDYFAHTPAGRYSRTWHYIDARDSPPDECGIQFERDCGGLESCVVSAIANMTEQLSAHTQGLPGAKSKADLVLPLRFLLHFIGDLHQPLHTENIDRGGNGITVVFRGKATNLHSVWDTFIPENHVGGKTFREAVKWTNELSDELQAGKFKEKKLDWAHGCLAKIGKVDAERAFECALSWADEVNKAVCSNVFDQAPANMFGRELGHEYFDKNRWLVEELVAKAGYRLAIFLNLLVTGRTGIEESAAGTEVHHQLLKQGGEGFGERVMLKFFLD